MNRYGQTITWSTPGAPHPFTGICTAYSERDATTRQLDDDEVGDNRALILHSRKGEISFEAKVSAGSTDFLDLSSGAALVGIVSGGVLLCSRAVERWALGQPKTASITATHYPDMTQASPAAPDALSAFTPDQSALSIVTPGATIIWGTYGFTHSAGIVQGLTIEQQLPITEDDPSPAGTLLGANSHGYLRTISLDLLSQAAAPAVRSVLAITGGPDHAANYLIESVETRFASKRGKMYAISAVWIPPLSS